MPRIKFDQIYETLKDNILNDRYPEHMLPREVELAEEFQCSRNTIHRAIAQLNDEGYVQSIKGKGTVILQALPIQNDRFFLNLRSYGSTPAITQYHKADVATSVMAFREMTVDEEISSFTGFQPGTEVYYIQRLRYLDNKPLLLDVNYFRKDVVTGLNVNIAQKSIYDYITNTLHKKILAAIRIVRIKKAEEKDKEYRSLGDYDCVGVIYNYVYINDGTLFEYTESHFVPDNFGFSEFVQY